MDYNPFLPEVRENPYPYYAYLQEHAPVYQVPDVGLWAITRYEDVLFILKNPQIFSASIMVAAMTGGLNPFTPEAPPMLSIDPPDHTRLRKLANRAFTPRRVASLERHIREVTQHLIEPIAAQGECDLTRDLAIPLPVIVIAELLGVPPERYTDFRRWANDQARATLPDNSAEDQAEIRQGFAEFRAYFQEMIAAYRRQPQDNFICDLVRAEEENQTLSAEEVLSMAQFVLLGGAETTTNLIGNAMIALCDHPEQLALIQANPALAPQLVEETLRYQSPIQWLIRQATQDVELSGTTVPAGAVILTMYGAANRDPRKFSEPDKFNILRHAEGQLAFGFGIHFCLGAQLARLEAKVALEMLLGRFSRFTRTEAQVTWTESAMVRGPKTLPLIVA